MVTGGTDFISSNVVQELFENGHNVVAYDLESDFRKHINVLREEHGLESV